MPRRKSPEPSTFELTEVLAQFLDNYRYGPPKTLKSYQDHLEVALLSWARKHRIGSLADVTPALARQYIVDEQARGLAQSTIVNRFHRARHFFRWCEEEKFIETSPFARVRPPKLAQLNVVGYSREEVRRLLRYASQAPGWLAKRDHAVVLLLLDTGARADELLTMSERAIDWPRGRVLLHGKGSKDRWVPLGVKARAVLREYLAARPRKGEAVWMTQRGTVMDYRCLAAMLTNLGEYAGVEECRAHRFRHTYASEWYERNRDIVALRNLLGHTKVETTQRYLRSLGVDYGTGSEYPSPGSWL